MSESLRPFEPPREELITFQGDQLLAVILPNDGVAVPIRMMCESLALDTATQVDRIREHPVLSLAVRMVRVNLDGRVRSVAALIHTMIPFWLATISPKQVKPEIQPKLEQYQHEVANVLSQLFYGTDATSTEPTSDPAITALRERTQGLFRELRMTRDALLAAQQQFMQDIETHEEQLAAHHQQLMQITDIVTELQDVIPVRPEQASYLQRAMKHIAHRVYQRRKDTGNRTQTEDNLYQLLFGQFKATFRLPRYDALPARRYHEALTWLAAQAAEWLPGDPDALPPHQERLL